MKKIYRQLWQSYFVKLLRGVPFPPEPLSERTEEARLIARVILAQLLTLGGTMRRI